METGCVVWLGPVYSTGYGRVKGTLELVHRRSLSESGVEIPEGMHVDHLCKNKLCYNVDHLDVVTCRENVMRGKRGILQRTGVCFKGHSDGMYINPVRQARCKTCKNASNKAYRERRVAKFI